MLTDIDAIVFCYHKFVCTICIYQKIKLVALNTSKEDGEAMF